MIIVGLTDIHGDTQRLAAMGSVLTEADVVVLAGDLTHFGRERDAAAVIDVVRQHNARVLAVPGNCDHPEVERYLHREGVSIHAGSAVIDGVAFVGLGGSLPCLGHTPNEFTEGKLADRLDQAVAGLGDDAPMILVSHQPPLNTANDLASIGRHVGSRAVRRFIEQRQPWVCFTGHIHEAAGIDTIGQTQIINPGPIQFGRYAYVNATDASITLEWRSIQTPDRGRT